jgi:putative transposase
LRSTNLLERSLEEVKRRTKVIGRFPGETSCLSLCWAVLDLFIDSARGLALTALEHRQLAQM